MNDTKHPTCTDVPKAEAACLGYAQMEVLIEAHPIARVTDRIESMSNAELAEVARLLETEREENGMRGLVAGDLYTIVMIEATDRLRRRGVEGFEDNTIGARMIAKALDIDMNL